LTAFQCTKAGCRMGESLAEKIRTDFGHLKIDVVIPIPDTSRPAHCSWQMRWRAYREASISADDLLFQIEYLIASRS